MNACWSVTSTMQAQGSGVIVNMGWDLATHGFEGYESHKYLPHQKQAYSALPVPLPKQLARYSGQYGCPWVDCHFLC